MNIKRIFLNDALYQFSRIADSQNNSPCSGDLPAGCDKYFFSIILTQVSHMVGHVFFQLIQRNEVVQVYNEQGIIN